VRWSRNAVRALPQIGPSVGAMLDLAPPRLPKASPGPGEFKPPGSADGRRVALLSGCAQSVLDPAINAATIRLLNQLGVSVVVPSGEACCGALVHHLGREAEALRAARNNIDRWIGAIAAGGIDAIVITASGCGTTIKDYGFMLRDDAEYAQKAKTVSALAKDICEYLHARSPVGATGRIEPLLPVRSAGLVVAYHSACSMQHGQKLVDEPKRLLRAAGFTVKDVPEGHLCCGSAGTYNILQPQIAARLLQRKVNNIARTKPDVIAAGNIGCITQIGTGLKATGIDVPLVHTAQLLDWAYGGPVPEALVGHPKLTQQRAVAAE
jgi:glycolate oxidase iron-sulfur subunit